MTIINILRSAGAGEQLVIAAMMVMGVLYLLKGRKFAKMFVSLMGTVWFAVSIALATAAISIGLGWVDPQPAKFIGDVTMAGKTLIESVIEELLKRVNVSL